MEKLVKLLSVLLIITMLFTVVGCGNDKKTDASDNNANNQTNDVSNDGNTESSNSKGVVASVMKEVNGRQVVYHNGKPFLYTAAHLRYDHLTNYV